MNKTRLLLACCIVTGMAVPLATPAAAQEAECPATWTSDTIAALLPDVSAQYVELGEGTITIRGDRAAAEAAQLVADYRNAVETSLVCAQELTLGNVAPYVECVQAEAAPILSSPDPAGRYLTVGADLVVTIDYGQALDDVIAIANCNGIVTSGG